MKWRGLLDKIFVINENEKRNYTEKDLEKFEKITIKLQKNSSLFISYHQKKINNSFKCIVELDQNKQLKVDFIIDNEKTDFILNTVLLGDRSRVGIVGKIQTKVESHHTIVTKQVHQGKDTKSLVKLKSTVDKNAFHSFNGLIHLEEGSLRSDAEQSHRVLLVHEEASVTSTPSLEVLHDDVQCAHSTTISHVDEESIIFLQLRGFEYKEARLLLIDSFLR